MIFATERHEAQREGTTMTKRNAIDILARAERAGHAVSVLLDTRGKRATWVVSIDRTRWVADYNDARATLARED